MKDSRRSSPIIHRKSVLICSKAEFVFFFYLDFLSRIFMIHRTAGEKEGYLQISFLPHPPTSQTLRHQSDYCCRELTSAHRWQPDPNRDSCTSSLEFDLSKLALIAAVVRRMLETRIALEKISCVLLKTILIKNNYPLNFIDSCIKPFLNKLYTPK